MKFGNSPLLQNQVPGAGMFQSRRVIQQGMSEVIRQRFYDRVLYPAAGANSLSFFVNPIGSGVTTAIGAVATTVKTLQDTNLNLQGTLPSGKQFLIESIELIYEPGSVSAANTFTPTAPGYSAAAGAIGQVNQLTDIQTFYSSGILNLNILSKPYLTELTQAFPPKASLEFNGAVAGTTATTFQGFVQGKAVGRPYWVEPSITLQPAVNFEMAIIYPGVVAMPSTFNGRVTCILDGYFMRAAQ
jgi:hypothetical protein